VNASRDSSVHFKEESYAEKGKRSAP
jgi:hypothetical protein